MSQFAEWPIIAGVTWKNPVATAADLPPVGNLTGDVRVVLDTDTLYVWNGSAWILLVAPGATPPGGSNTQVQFNNGGAFAGDTGLIFNSSTDALTVGGTISASNFSGASFGTNTGDQTITLTSDVSGSGTGSFATTVISVGGSTAANIHTAEIAANAATSSNVPSTILKRDSSGNVSAGTFTGSLFGNASTATQADKASKGTTVSVSTNASFFPLFVASSSNSSQDFNLDSDFLYNPSNNTLTATNFSGTATNSRFVETTNDNSNNSTVFPTWVTASSGNLPQKVSASNWGFVPASGDMSISGTMTAAFFNGNASSATTATTATNADNLLVTQTVGDDNEYMFSMFPSDFTAYQAASIDNTVVYNPSLKRLRVFNVDLVGNLTVSGDSEFLHLNPSTALIIDNTNTLSSSSTTDTELGYVHLVTSPIQDQLDGKISTSLSPAQIYIGNNTNIAQARTISGDLTVNFSGVTTIANSAITNAKRANMAQSTISGRAAGAGTGAPTDLSVSQTLAVLGILTATATLDFPSVTAGGGIQDLTITVTGAVVGNPVSLGLPASPNAGLTFDAFVSSTNTVTIRATNTQTLGNIDPASASYRVIVFN